MDISFLFLNEKVTGWKNTGKFSKVFYNFPTLLPIWYWGNGDNKVFVLSAYSEYLDKSYSGPVTFVDVNGWIYEAYITYCTEKDKHISHGMIKYTSFNGDFDIQW